MKECSRCGVTKVLSDYYKHAKCSDGYQGVCKECYKESKRKLYYGGQNKYQAEYRLMKLYGITTAQKNSLLEKQGGMCAICGTDDAGGTHGVWNVDHNHITNEVRGLLCWNCNTAIGKLFVDDKPENVLKAAAYLGIAA